MFRSIIDRALYWADLDELNAWKAAHPDDLRGQVVEYIAKAATA